MNLGGNMGSQDCKYYAHSVKGEKKSSWQTLREHLKGVGFMAASFAKNFGAENHAEIAGLLHDLGKYTQEFQARLDGGARVDHSTWGAIKALEIYPQIGQLLAYTIACIKLMFGGHRLLIYRSQGH